MKRLLKKSISVALSIAMIATQVELSAIDVKADVDQEVRTKLTSGVNTILQSDTYYLSEDVRFEPDENRSSGLTIAEGANVVIYLNGHTLTATGSDATNGDSGSAGSTSTNSYGAIATGGDGGAGGSGGYAGIKLPKGATLTFVGVGTVNAVGGNAGRGGNGGKGGNANMYDGTQNDFSMPGSGGGGGGAGGGAGAGIGTDGTDGSDGTTGGNAVTTYAINSSSYVTSPNYANASLASDDSKESGTLYVYNDYYNAITINAAGGSRSTVQGNIGLCGTACLFQPTFQGPRYTASAGAGGASGGGGGAANNIGSGGTGGTGGNGGASGASNRGNNPSFRCGYGGSAGKGGNNRGAAGQAGQNANNARILNINGNNANGQTTTVGTSPATANAGTRGASGAVTNLYLRGVYAFISAEKTYQVGDYISQDDITAYEVYSTNRFAEFDGLKELSTYYNDSMVGYNNQINTAGWFAKEITKDDYTINDAETDGDYKDQLKVTEDLIKLVTKTTKEHKPTDAVKITLKNVDTEKAVSEGFVSGIDIDIRDQQKAEATDESVQADLGDYPTEGDAAAYNDKTALNTVTYDGKKHSVAELIKNTGYGDSNDVESENEITEDFFKKGLNSSAEETSYWFSDYALTPYYCVKYEPYAKFDSFEEANYLTGTEEGVIIEGQTDKSPYFEKGGIDKEYFYNAGYYSVTVVVPYKYYTYRFFTGWSDAYYFYRTYNFNILIRQADLGIKKASDTVYENTKVQNHTFTRNVEGQNESVFGEFVYSSDIQAWDNNEGRSANKATPLIEDITWEFNIESLRDQNNYLCQNDGPFTGDALNSYYSNNNGTLIFTEDSVAKRTIDMDVTVHYEDEQSTTGTVTPVEDLNITTITSDDTVKTVKSVYAENVGIEATLNKKDTSLGFRVLEGDAVTGSTTLGTKIDATTLPELYQGYFGDLVENDCYKGDLYVITVKAGENTIMHRLFTDDSKKDYSELLEKVTDSLPACEFYDVTAYDVTVDYIGLYYTTETGADGRLPDWNGEEEFNWVSAQVNFKLDVDPRDISINPLDDIDKIYDGTNYIVSQTVSEQGDVTAAAGYVIDVATVTTTETQFEKSGTTVFFNYYDVSGDDSNAMKVELSGTYETKDKGAEKTASITKAKLFATENNNSYLNYNIINLPATVSGNVNVANMYFKHNLFGTMEVYDSTPLHEVMGVSCKAYLLDTKLDKDGYITPADTKYSELVEKNDAKTKQATFTTNENAYDYDATYELVNNKYSPTVLGIDNNTGEITEVAIHTKGGTNPSQFPSQTVSIKDYGNFTLVKANEEKESDTYGECQITNKNDLTVSDELTEHIMRYRIIGNENTYDVFLPVNQINKAGFNSIYVDRYVSKVTTGEEIFDYLTVYEEGDGASFKFTVPQDSYLEDLYLVDLGEYKSYLTEDIKTFDEMKGMIETNALGSFNTQETTLNASENPLYLKLDTINDVETETIPDGNAQVGGSTFKFTLTTGDSTLGNNKSIAIVPVFKSYNLINDVYLPNLKVESKLDTDTGETKIGFNDTVYINYKTDFETGAYDEAGYGQIDMSYTDATSGAQVKKTLKGLKQTIGYHSLGINTESAVYSGFFSPLKLVPGTEVNITIKVWRDGITEALDDLTTVDPDAFDEVTFKWTVTEAEYNKLFNDDTVIFRTSGSLNNNENIKAYGFYGTEDAPVKFGKVDRLIEKQDDNTWKVIKNANMLEISDTWYIADNGDGTRVVISNDAENNYPMKSVNDVATDSVPLGTSFYPTYETVKVSEVDATSADENDWTVTDLGYARLVFGEINPLGTMIFSEKEEDVAKVQPYAEATYEYETDYEKTQPYSFEGWTAKEQGAETAIEVNGSVELTNQATLFATKKIHYVEFYALEDLLTYGIYSCKAETINFTEMAITDVKPESGKACECTVTDMSTYHVNLFKDADWYYDNLTTQKVEDLTSAQVTVTEEEPIPKFYLATQKVEEIVADDVEIFIGDTVKEQYTALPEDAYDKTVRFESVDEGIATVDADGTIVGVGVGTTTIKITAEDVGEVVKEINVVIKPILVEKITLENVEIYVGDTVEMTPVIEPENATDKTLTWKSMDETVATVDKKGTVTGIAYGETTILAVAVDEGKVVGTATVSVKDKEPTKDELRANNIEINKGLAIIPKNNSVSVQWNKVEGAEGYEVFVQICSKKFAKGTKIKAGSDINKISVKKVNGKKISKKKNYKIMVKAYKTINGKKTYIAKSITGHFVSKKNKKYTNAKKIKLTKKSFTLEAGKTAKIKGKVILQSKKKKPLSKKHAATLRFSVADKNIATVSKKGKITAVSPGTTTVYVYAKNGLTKTVKVTVQ